jgi:hypothetical protein
MDGTITSKTNQERLSPRDTIQVDVGMALEKDRWFAAVFYIDAAEDDQDAPQIKLRLSMQNYAHGDFSANIKMLRDQCDLILQRDAQSSFASPQPPEQE